MQRDVSVTETVWQFCCGHNHATCCCHVKL